MAGRFDEWEWQQLLPTLAAKDSKERTAGPVAALIWLKVKREEVS
jgi:hypothetical protein